MPEKIDRAALYRSLAVELADQVAERNQPPATSPAPHGGLIYRQEPDRLARLVADDLTDASTLNAEAARLEATAAVVKEHATERARREAIKAEREAERARQEHEADAALLAMLDKARGAVLAAFPGLDAVAAQVATARRVHADAVYALGIAPAVADRVLWAHPLASLLPLLNMFGDSDRESRA